MLCALSGLLYVVVGTSAIAAAEEAKAPSTAAPAAAAVQHPMTSDLDGLYLTLGPVAGALHIQDTWNSAVGGEVSLVYLREHRWPALFGISVGGVVFDQRDGIRTWAEAELAIDKLPVKLGVSGGLAIEFDRTIPPHFGVQGTLWVFAGVVPYVRVGTLESYGAFFEAGVMIKIPVKIRY
jgi:hypothetical protein